MIKLGSISEIMSGYNVVRLPDSEKDRKYSNTDFEYDFYRMKLADPTSSIIYRQSSGSSHMSATILSDENKDKFISQVFSIMKVNRERLNPWYLCWLLNESRGLEKQINILLQGSVHKMSDADLVFRLVCDFFIVLIFSRSITTP